MDIHAKTGQRALAAAGLLDDFHRVARTEGEATRLLKKDGTVVLDENESGKRPEQIGEMREEEEGGGERRGRPEIDRRALKDLLLSALPPGVTTAITPHPTRAVRRSPPIAHGRAASVLRLDCAGRLDRRRGGAAHLMTPFAGVGVNVGMVDALELAEGIVGYFEGEERGGDTGEGDGDELARVLRKYEEGMFERSRSDAELTARMMGLHFGEDGCEALLRVIGG
ncbi:hypothetical protein AAE478_004103 [Parahypoxylon ruwenzoriense]